MRIKGVVIAFAVAKLLEVVGVAITQNLKFSSASVLNQYVFVCFLALSDGSLSPKS